MKKKQIIGLLIAAGVFIAVGVSSVFTNSVAQLLAPTNSTMGGFTQQLLSDSTEESVMTPEYDYIGQISVEGVIQEQVADTSFMDVTTGYQHDNTMAYLDAMMQDDHNKGLILYVDTPGGTVYEGLELYDKIVEYQVTTNRPVWTYMAHYAASAGYMISAPTDKIYAHQSTTTGSIGVILSALDMTELYEKLGIKEINIASGRNKAGTWNEEQIAIYQELVDADYEKFVKIVADGRDMSVNQVKKLADGRIYSSPQALELGLIDEISSFDTMKKAFKAELNIDEIYAPAPEVDVFSQLFAKLNEIKPKSEAEILLELKDELGNGGRMYYATDLY